MIACNDFIFNLCPTIISLLGFLSGLATAHAIFAFIFADVVRCSIDQFFTFIITNHIIMKRANFK